jgi:hypothetical protein
MSDKREVFVRYGEHKFKLVRKEFVYEINDENPEGKLIKNGGDFILRLTGHTAGTWEDYKQSQEKTSFNTIDYQRKFLEDNNYKTLDDSPAVTGQASPTPTRPGAEPRLERPQAVVTPQAPSATPETETAILSSAEILNLTPEQQAALDLLDRDGVLEKIIDRRIAEKIKSLEDRISQLEDKNNPESQIEPEATVTATTNITETTAETTLNPVETTPPLEPETPAPTAQAEITTDTSTDSSHPLRRGWLPTRWRQLRGIPPYVSEIREVPETGRRYYITETEERVYLDETRGSGLGRTAAIGAGILGLLGILYIAHEVEEIEHAKGQPAKTIVIKKPSIKKIIQTPTTKEGEDKETTTTSNEKDNTVTTPTTTTVESGQDNDESLNGVRAYNENSNVGGHGLQLDIQKDMRVTKNPNGTYNLALPSGKNLRLQWRESGRLTPDTVRALEAEHYEVGVRTSNFTDRENRTFTHQYSVIGDKEANKLP